MIFRRFKYLFLSMMTVISIVMGYSCSDEYFGPDGDDAFNDPDAIKFSASAGISSAVTRSEKLPVYEPLELTGNGSALYLHTYVTDRFNYTPGDVVESDNEKSTRGHQVTTAEDLINYHKDFYVHGAYKTTGEEYIEWAQTQVSTANNFWRTAKTRYWQGETMFSFHAVSPSSEFSNLKNCQTDIDNSMSFSYTARKSGNNRDAEAQSDLLVAAGSCNKPGSVNGRAPLLFHHALSAIKFAVRDVLDGEVINIQIAGVNSTGRCQYNAGDDGEGSFIWTEQSGSETYSQDFNYAVSGRPIIDPGDDSQDILLNDVMPEKTFMLIPQMIPDNAEIIVTLNRTNPGIDDDGAPLPNTITVRGKIKDNNVQEWKPGHEYVYTISTSKDNWVYVFRATGNHNSQNGTHYNQYNASADQIYVYSPSEEKHDTYNDNAFFNVRSYRYRANKPEVVEDLPWTASHGDARQYRVRTSDVYVEGRDIPAAEWITDSKGLKGTGSHGTQGDRHDLSFATHHQMTDWPGDKWLQDQVPYAGNAKETPWDLSTCGGSTSRNTANCYVIDREGWYFFPFVYGNAIKDGATNADAYTFSGIKTGGLKNGNIYLDRFLNHLGTGITAPDIPQNYCKTVSKTWADVYNVISDLEIITYGGKLGVRFRANKFNLQQGTSCIAVFDSSNRVVWSWHIWITEHWLDPTTGKPHAIQTNSGFGFEATSKGGRRNRGDLQVTNPDLTAFKYYMAPYNLGWCDPKNVDYLRRPGTMSFVQYFSNGKPTGKTASLPIMQDGKLIEYKVGNNTYYQFGRKDPIVGFVDRVNTVKRNFGPYQYAMAAQPVALEQGILHPNTLFCKGPNATTSNDWCSAHYINLWDNNKNVAWSQDGSDYNTTAYCYGLKTVYDPCPPGYMVPPAAVWKSVGKGAKGTYTDMEFKDADLRNFTGERVDDYTFKIWANVTHTDANAIWLTSTGHRWYTDDRPSLGLGGDNFNPHLVYLWSSTASGRNDFTGFGLALGKDATGWGVCVFFYGRRSMARPVRPIREAYSHP